MSGDAAGGAAADHTHLTPGGAAGKGGGVGDRGSGTGPPQSGEKTTHTLSGICHTLHTACVEVQCVYTHRHVHTRCYILCSNIF